MPASMHPGAQSWCMYKSVRLGATWIGGGRSSALFTILCLANGHSDIL